MFKRVCALTGVLTLTMLGAGTVGLSAHAAAPPPRVSIASAAILEGATGTRLFGLTVSLSDRTAAAVSVDYTTSPGTAHASTDYTTSNGTVTIPAGAIERVIQVPIRGDEVPESSEQFSVVLSNPVNASLGRATGSATILNDDHVSSVRIGVGRALSVEGDTAGRSLRFVVALNRSSSGSVSVHYGTAAGSATADDDFDSFSGSLTFPPGTTTRVVSVRVHGDTGVEGDESLTLGLSAPTGALISRATGVGTIANDDVAPPVTVPGAPSSITANGFAGRVDLAWSGPADDGGVAVAAYAVRSSADDGATWTLAPTVSAPTTATSVSALSNGHDYVFEVAATNAVGTSPWSAPTASVQPVLGPNDWAGVTAGLRHTCGWTASGLVDCWGGNDHGDLGDGTETVRASPVRVLGMPSPVVEVSAGDAHTCALTDAGGVWCWGQGDDGRLGNGVMTDSAVPVPVTGMESGVVEVSAGGVHTCAVTDAGAVWCWGEGLYGSLGNGGDSASALPVAVAGLAPVAHVSAGTFQTCAVTVTGAVWCWGDATYRGSLGNGLSWSLTPVQITDGASGVSAGRDHACAIRSGMTWCWGPNQYFPAAILGGLLVASVDAAAERTCVVTVEGRANCWGRNAQGEAGLAGYIYSVNPFTVSIDGLDSGVVMLAAGAKHTCAVTSDGRLRCLGNDGSGQLGDGATAVMVEPETVPGLESGVVDVAMQRDHACAVNSASEVACWGMNAEGQLGNGTTTDALTPVLVTGLSGVVQVATGYNHSCARTVVGAVWCWGSNASAQLGVAGPSRSLVPVLVPEAASGVAKVVAGSGVTCVLSDTGGVSCWGTNSYDALGAATPNPGSVTPVAVTGLASGVVDIAAGDFHICALTDAGAVRCWGYLPGLVAFDPFMTVTPVAVPGFQSGVTSISSGYERMCATFSDGSASCFRGSTQSQTGLAQPVATVATAYSSICATDGGGSVRCSGVAGYGSLGDGSVMDRANPVDIELSGQAVQLALGFQRGCARTAVGAVECWGLRFASRVIGGELTIATSTPVFVVPV